MPVILVLVLALFGIGYFTRECPSHTTETTVTVEPPSIAPEHAAWARACQARLAEAAHEFEAAAGFGCTPGNVTITTLPSGIDEVEYVLQTADGALHHVEVAEEPDDDGVAPGWHGAPRCGQGYDREYQVVRHDHGRLARISARSSQGMLFAQVFESAASFCVEQAR